MLFFSIEGGVLILTSVNVKINAEVYKNLKAIAKEKNTTASQLIRNACSFYLEALASGELDKKVYPHVDYVIRDSISRLEDRLAGLLAKTGIDVNTVLQFCAHLLKIMYKYSDDEKDLTNEQLKELLEVYRKDAVMAFRPGKLKELVKPGER
ncbi:MAG: hypothetical protein K6T65_16380 [Peptococcaceae bacterium]|nr:hypothetical protein [Peptococcaceae bacterium]